MNSLRIGAIGITVEYWGRKMAEGLLHDFEGWVVFMFSTAALLGVAALLARTGKPRIALREAFEPTAGAEAPTPGPRASAVADAVPRRRALVGVAAVHISYCPRAPNSPPRAIAGRFPDSFRRLERPARLDGTRLPGRAASSTTI